MTYFPKPYFNDAIVSWRTTLHSELHVLFETTNTCTSLQL